jgi:hypothetical protein
MTQIHFPTTTVRLAAQRFAAKTLVRPEHKISAILGLHTAWILETTLDYLHSE